MKIAVLTSGSLRDEATRLLVQAVGTDLDVTSVGDDKELFRSLWRGIGLVVFHTDRNGIDAISLISEVKRVSHGRVPVLGLFDSVTVGLLRTAITAGLDGAVYSGDAPESLNLAVHALRSGKRFVSPGLSDAIMQPPSDDAVLENLTPKERSVFSFIAQGLTTKAISDRMSISVKTVETHRNNLGRKLGFPNKAQLVALALKTGLVSEAQLRIAA